MRFAAALVLVLVHDANSATMNTDAIYMSTISGQPESRGITFSSFVVSASSLILQGTDGYLSSESSVTASAFFGNSIGLSEMFDFKSTQTFTGSNTLSSSFTVNSGGRQIILSTGTGLDNIRITSLGVLSFSPELHNSSSTTIPEATTTNQYCGPCVAGSTLTITTTGGRVEVVFSGATTSNNSANAGINFLQDGQFVANMSSAAVVGYYRFGNPFFATRAVRYLLDAPSPGSHSYCLSLCTNSSGPFGSNTIFIANNNKYTNRFFVKEIK